MSSPIYNIDSKKVWVAGHKGLAGSALIRFLRNRNIKILTVDRREVDLRSQQAVHCWLTKENPEVVIVAAGTVGGIAANARFPAKFLYDNLQIASNIINSAYQAGVEKLLFLGSTCIYPKFADQPIKEESLLSGPLESTNQWYAIAKIAGTKLVEAFRQEHGCDFISAMPTNLYGPNDNFDLETSHVLGALLWKIHCAKLASSSIVEIWGTGTPRREFMHVDDLAAGCIFLLEHYSDALHINLGTGTEISIRDLADLIAEIVGFKGSFVFDTSKPDGTPRKCSDITRIQRLGWSPRIDLRTGLQKTYQWLLSNDKYNQRQYYL